ncbi:hypothetical protein [Salibacterium halotolerans]|nr:hypothetical protein [Salibacterium halotolerans]
MNTFFIEQRFTIFDTMTPTIHDDNTHIFDNLLPMLARQQWEEQ